MVLCLRKTVEIMKRIIKKALILTVGLTTIYGFTIDDNSRKGEELILLQQKTVQKFYSDYQVDRTPSGGVVEGREEVTIIFENDPKPKTKGNERFEDLPKGTIVIKYDRFEPIVNEVVYITKNGSDVDIYAITDTTSPYDIVYVQNNAKKDDNYRDLILFGKSNPNNLSELPTVFTLYYSNKIK